MVGKILGPVGQRVEAVESDFAGRISVRLKELVLEEGEIKVKDREPGQHDIGMIAWRCRGPR